MRQTIDLVLPESEAKVVLYDKFTHGDSIRVQKLILEHVKLDPAKGEKHEIGEIPGGVAIEMNELSIKLLIKEATLEGVLVTDIDQFIYDLSQEHGSLLTEKVSEISSSSQLTPEIKKK